MLPALPTLLAETHMAEVSLQYREDVATGGISGLWYLLIPVGAVALGFTIYKIFDRPPAIVNTPMGMLHELCKVHRVPSSGRKLLERIAEEAELQHPATLFLGVNQFETAVKKAGKCIRYGRRENAVLGALRRRIFAA